jgi:ribosome modulation factor
LLVKVEGSLNGRSGHMVKDFSLYWDIDSLNKAYQQGYMTGVMGMANNHCPYSGEIVEAAWEAGWEDGIDECELQRPAVRIA